MTNSWHLFEVLISSSQVWLKMQASCSSSQQSVAFFESRFNGIDHITNGARSVIPFKLSQRSHYIANWACISEQLPAEWDEDEFQIVGTPYPWCETLSDNCDCHGAEGRLDEAFCSDFGLYDETEKRENKSKNVRHWHYIRRMEETIARRDKDRRRERRQGGQFSPPQGTVSASMLKVPLSGN